MKIKLLEINQYGKKSYLGKLSFEELSKIAKLSLRSEDGKDGWFQRSEESGKVNKIFEYMKENNDIPLFSTPIVLGINTGLYYEFSDTSKVELIGNSSLQIGTKIIESNDINLNISDDINECAIIVDGQHRFRGMRKFFDIYSEKREDFEIPVVFLLDYDIYELGEIFININFKQKPVNKSLYYDIFGSLPGGVSEIKVAHLITKDLQEQDTSPLFGVIKVLGKGDGLISQSFIVEKIINLLSKNEIWLKDYLRIKDFFGDTDDEGNIDAIIKNTEEYNKIKNFLFEYFSAIKQLFNTYGYEVIGDKINPKGILFKTTGIGALFRLIEDFYLNGKENDVIPSLNKVILDSERLFGTEGDYAKGGSEGLQSRLYKELVNKIFYNTGKDIVRNGILKLSIGIEFSFKDIYDKVFVEMKNNYPNNNFLEAKILQLLQILRDEGVIEFVPGKRGVYKRIN